MLGRSPFSWGYYDSNVNFTTAVPSTAAYGTTFAAGASNADGTAVSMLTLAQDVQMITIAFNDTSATGAETATLADILIDPAGGTSWANLIDDLVCGYLIATSTGQPISHFYTFPLFIKAGSALGVQARCAHSTPSTSSDCSVWVWGQPSRPEMWWCGQKVESLGINAASSSGTNVTAGISNAWGSWTSIGSPTTGRYGAVQMQANTADATQLVASYHFELGYGSTRLVMPPLHVTGASSEQKVCFGPWGHNPVNIAAGTQLQARGMSSAGTVEAWDLAVYGTY
jgi:hypothetical protein